MNRYARKPDANQAEVVAALRQDGWNVFLTFRLGGGFPDLVASKHNTNVLVEIKAPGGKLNDTEKEFHLSWKGPLVIAFSGADAVQKCEGHITHI